MQSIKNEDENVDISFTKVERTQITKFKDLNTLNFEKSSGKNLNEIEIYISKNKTAYNFNSLIF